MPTLIKGLDAVLAAIRLSTYSLYLPPTYLPQQPLDYRKSALMEGLSNVIRGGGLDWVPVGGPDVVKNTEVMALLTDDGWLIPLITLDTLDVGRVPAYLFEMDCQASFVDNLFTQFAAQFEAVGLRVVHGRTDLVCQAGTKPRSDVLRNHRKAVTSGMTTSRIFSCPADFASVMCAGWKHFWSNDARVRDFPIEVQLTWPMSAYDFYENHVYRHVINDQTLGYSLCHLDGSAARVTWVTTLRSPASFNVGFNFIEACVCELMLEYPDTSAFNLGIDIYPYKRRFNPVPIPRKGIRFVAGT